MADRHGSAPGPLHAVRVLDLTQALAGPYCTMLLADLGADVMKVEPPSGDMTRFGGPFTKEDTERSYGGYFASINRGKRSIVLDLKDDADREAFLGLAATVDVVVENSRAGVMDRLGIGYETLAERNPKLVYAAIRGFGDPRTGESPYADWPSYDIVAQAMGGLVSITGTADGEVMKCGPSVGDIFSGTLAAVGLLAAVVDARSSGQGQFVDVAMYDAVLSLCEAAAYQHSYTGRIMAPTGNGHPVIAPFDVYPTSDGHCALGTPSDAGFVILCERMKQPALSADDRFATSGARLRNRPALDEQMVAWTSSLSTAEIVDLLGGDVPVGPVNDMAAIYADPHVAAGHARRHRAARRFPPGHVGRSTDQDDRPPHGCARPATSTRRTHRRDPRRGRAGAMTDEATAEPVDGLRVEIDQGIATVWLDRPAKRNAVNYDMWNGIAAHCERLAADDEVRLLVVRGAGGHFCAGADIAGMGDVSGGAYRRANEAADAALAAFPKPSIAVISGSCIGGGVEIAVACDLRIADTTSRFGITPARLGIVYPASATARVVRLIGPSATKHLLYSAELIDAERALRIGLVDEVHDPALLSDRARGLTVLMTGERSLLTQMASKAIVDSLAADDRVDAAVEERWLRVAAAGSDAAEGVAAFVERRGPNFAWTPGEEPR